MRSRRRFLKDLTLVSTSLCVPAFLVKSLQAARGGAQGASALAGPGRILLVLELAGGSDGLNTIVPYGRDEYYTARPGIAIPSSQVLPIDETIGFHPALREIQELFQSGRMAIVQGVGYPNPNRSHFRARDIWHTARPEEAAGEGWLARYFETLPQGNPLEGVNIGGKVPRAMVSAEGSSPSITSIDNYQLQSDPKYPEDSPAKNAAFQRMLSEPNNSFGMQEFVARTTLEATFSSAQILEGQKNYQSTIEYPDTALATNLRTIAQIIAADLGVRVFYATIGGFDTHANQIQGGNSVLGTHASLLSTVSGAVSAFMADMQQMGREQEVLVMTFSEFGRRVQENASSGTDHGTANQMFLFSGALQPGLYGTHPGVAPKELDPLGDLIYTVDFRSVYATALAGWLGADATAILGASWPQIAFL